MLKSVWPRGVLLVVLAVVASLSAGGPAYADPEPSGVHATADGLTVKVAWDLPGDASGVTGYQVTTSPETSPVIEPAGARSAVLAGVRPNTDYAVRVAAITADGAGRAVQADAQVRVAAPGGSLHVAPPTVVVDSRRGLATQKAAVKKNHVLTFPVAGRAGVPSTGAAAVVLQVTASAPGSSGTLTVYPAGGHRPGLASVAFAAHRTTTVMAVPALGTGGRVSVVPSVTTHLNIAVIGWFSTAAAASPAEGLFTPVTPQRIAVSTTALKSHQTLEVPVTGRASVPASGVFAVALNLTSVKPGAAGTLTAYASGAARPSAVALTYAAGQTVANRVIVPVGGNGRITLYNSAAKTTKVAVDVSGWSTAADATVGGSYFVPLPAPQAVNHQTIPSGKSLLVTASGKAGLPARTSAAPPTSVLATVAAGSTKNGTLTSYASLTPKPGTGDVSFTAGRTAAGSMLTAPGADGGLALASSVSSTKVSVAFAGYFVGGTVVPASTETPKTGTITSVTGGNTEPGTVTLAAGAPAPVVGDVIAQGDPVGRRVRCDPQACGHGAWRARPPRSSTAGRG